LSEVVIEVIGEGRDGVVKGFSGEGIAVKREDILNDFRVEFDFYRRLFLELVLVLVLVVVVVML